MTIVANIMLRLKTRLNTSIFKGSEACAQACWLHLWAPEHELIQGAIEMLRLK